MDCFCKSDKYQLVDSSFDWLGTGTGIRYFLLFPNNLYININRDLLKVVTGSGIEVPLNHSGFTTLMKISFRIHMLYLDNRGFLSVTYGSAPFSWIREAEFGTGCISRYRYRYSFESSWLCELSRRHVSWLSHLIQCSPYTHTTCLRPLTPADGHCKNKSFR